MTVQALLSLIIEHEISITAGPKSEINYMSLLVIHLMYIAIQYLAPCCISSNCFC